MTAKQTIRSDYAVGLTRDEFTALMAAVAATCEEAAGSDTDPENVLLLLDLLTNLSDALRGEHSFSSYEIRAIVLVCEHSVRRLHAVGHDSATAFAAELDGIRVKLVAMLDAHAVATTIVQPTSEARH